MSICIVIDHKLQIRLTIFNVLYSVSPLSDITNPYYGLWQNNLIIILYILYVFLSNRAYTNDQTIFLVKTGFSYN